MAGILPAGALADDQAGTRRDSRLRSSTGRLMRAATNPRTVQWPHTVS